MYQVGKRTRRQKNSKVLLQVAAVLGIALVAVALILHNDISKSTGPKTSVPIITEVGGVEDSTITINEPLFMLKLPSDWKQTNRVQSRAANYYEWQSTKKGGDDRRLRLHIDTLPTSYKIVRLQPVRPNGNSLLLGNLSDDCINFGGPERRQSNAPFQARWENVLFTCDPVTANQTIGTGTVEGGIAARLGGHSYFFYYEDHNIRPDDKILQDILQSFQAKH